VNTPAANESLLFAWEPANTRRFAIFGFLALSAVGHAICFYLFQIVYPPTVALLPPPARVNVISENTEEGRTLLRWIAAEDPALATTTQRPAEAKAFMVPKLSHVPSYLTIQPALKALLATAPDLQAPSYQPPGPVPIERAKNAVPLPATPTAIIFSENLDSLGKVEKPAMKFSASTREPPQSAGFRLGVTPNGVVRYCFLQNTSGDSALDEQAGAYLMRCRFVSKKTTAINDPDRLNWATATIEWGNDVVAPPSAPAAPALP
jgi:hypothetical protein